MKFDWWRKLIDEESGLMKKVDCYRKLIDKKKRPSVPVPKKYFNKDYLSKTFLITK